MHVVCFFSLRLTYDTFSDCLCLCYVVLAGNVFLTHTLMPLTYAMVNVCKQQTGNQTGRYSACVIYVKLFISLIMSLFLNVCVCVLRCLHAYTRMINTCANCPGYFAAFCHISSCISRCMHVFVRESARFPCSVYFRGIGETSFRSRIGGKMCGKCRCGIDK